MTELLDRTPMSPQTSGAETSVPGAHPGDALGAIEEGAPVQLPADGPNPTGERVSNPLRIGQIGVDHIQVFIRPVHGDAELLELVARLEQLLDAGYDTVNVILEGEPAELSAMPVEFDRLRRPVTTGQGAAPRTDVSVARWRPPANPSQPSTGSLGSRTPNTL